MLSRTAAPMRLCFDICQNAIDCLYNCQHALDPRPSSHTAAERCDKNEALTFPPETLWRARGLFFIRLRRSSDAAPLLEAIGLPRKAFTPVFAIARAPAWIVHALEQQKTGGLSHMTSAVQHLGHTSP
jgi:hypothetical protein